MKTQGHLRHLSTRDDVKWNLRKIVQMVKQNFHEDSTINDFLSSREPSCVFDNLEPSEGPAIKTDPVPNVAMKEEFEFSKFSFVSLVVSSSRRSH